MISRRLTSATSCRQRSAAKWNSTEKSLQEQKGEAPEGDLEKSAADAMTTKTPLHLPSLPADEVANAYVFLASDAARLVSGTSVDVTGGDSAHNV
jgi:NAD(P)-dependent dehydrogenase (short-subunit alcohol dehydrogenase family)